MNSNLRSLPDLEIVIQRSLERSARYGVDLPIADAVRSVVWEGADPKLLARDLTSRSLKPEFYGI